MAKENRHESELAERRQQQRAGLQREERGLSPWEPGAPALWSTGPFGFMRRMMDEMDRMFEDLGFGAMPSTSAGFGETGERFWTPRVDVRQRDDTFVVRADLPGVREEDLEVEAEGGMLRIRGERREEREKQEGRFRRTECSYGSFVRTIPLPEGADADQAKATFANGVLEVTVPAPERRGRRIEIASGRERAESQTTH